MLDQMLKGVYVLNSVVSHLILFLMLIWSVGCNNTQVVEPVLPVLRNVQKHEEMKRPSEVLGTEAEITKSFPRY